MDELVSVLMSVYNTPLSFLREATQSIIDQTYKNIEFIIIDDSSDRKDTLEYLESVKESDDRIILVHNDVNLGLTRSLNIGLSRCRGKYIARMDSDDFSYPSRIRTQVNYMEEHPGVSLSGGRIALFGKAIGSAEPEIPNICSDVEEYRIRSLIQHSGPPHPTFMFRTAFLREFDIKYRDDIKKAQDYAIITDILKAGGDIRIIDDVLLKYRLHRGQITNYAGAEQKIYQFLVSRAYVRSVFPHLSRIECMAISLLGYNGKWEDLLNAINSKESLRCIADFEERDYERLNDPGLYIKSIKSILMYNDNNKIYNDLKFELIMRHVWWKRAVRMTRELHRPWGLKWFTLVSYIKSQGNI